MTALREDIEFYWVWTKHGRLPKRFHASPKSAEREAKRLARRFPEWKFIVLHAYAKFGTEEARRLTNEAREARKARSEAASCDTQPKAGDVQQAPLVSGAVANGETPKA